MVSVLNDVKKALGLESNYDAFDVELILHINAALGTLTQLGVGSDKGMRILDSSNNWLDLFGEDSPLLDQCKIYVYTKVRMIFDPPSNSVTMKAFEDYSKELEWRIVHSLEEILHD